MWRRSTKNAILGLVASSLACGLYGCSPVSDSSCRQGGPNLLETATWETVYARYFGPGTPGHCGNSNCHGQRTIGGFLAGTTSDSCFLGLLSARLVRYDCSMDSLLVDPQKSPVIWFSRSGRMPADNQMPNAQAQMDITTWLSGGALAPIDGGSSD